MVTLIDSQVELVAVPFGDLAQENVGCGTA